MILGKDLIGIFLQLECSNLNVYSNINNHERKLHQNSERYYCPAKMNSLKVGLLQYLFINKNVHFFCARLTAFTGIIS